MSSSSSHEQFDHLQIPLELIASSTKDFSDANPIKGSPMGKAYRGLLRLPLLEQPIDIELEREIPMFSAHKYKRLLPMPSSSSNKQFDHLQIPLELIASATKDFSDANLIKGSALGKAYKGQLSLSPSEQPIDIVAQRFDHEHRDQDAEFWKEISMLSKLKHKNLVSMVGFCVESGKIIIYKHKAKGSLDTFLKDPRLTWMQRLQICLGVAHGLSYIHYDNRRNFSFIHCDIRSSKIWLDDNWEAKLFGFELSLMQTADKRNSLSFTDVYGTHGYRDPTYNQSGSVTHKSDMYSFGVVLFEILCGKKAVMVDDDNRLLAPLVISQYEWGRLDAMIDPGLRKQMDPQSLQIFSEIAYYCLKEQRSQRPNIGVVVIELEKALESQWKHQSPLILKASIKGTTSKNLKGKDLKHLEIPLNAIETATNHFAKTPDVKEGTYGEVFIAELDHFDQIKSFFPSDENNIGERPMKRSTVAIKRIKIREDKQGEDGFHAEIEILTSCKHRNVVSLLGFCMERSHMILVYEHASNGSLQTYMGHTGMYLTWVQRIKISIEIARGLNYLHTKIEDERRIIHRDIKSDNILLGENFEAKIADFGLSKFRPEDQQVSTIDTMSYAGTDFYLDPEYSQKGKLSSKIDIYSMGVVLLELLSGSLANDPVYINEDKNGIVPVARRRFNDSTMKDMVDPRLWVETHENSFALTKGPNQYALHAFLEIAHECVAETQPERPTAGVVVKRLEEALSFQEGNLKHLEIPLIHILSATDNFAKTYLIAPPSGDVYKAELDHFDSKNFLSFEKKRKSELPKKRNIVAIKRIFTREDKQVEKGFHAEIEMLTSCKHPNIVSLLGFCEEGRHMILVFEHASNGSLDTYLRSTGNLYNLSWVQRIKICIDIARGLSYLHTKMEDEQRLIHIDLKSRNILLGENQEAKIAGFELSKFHPEDQQLDAFYKKNSAGGSEYDTTVGLKNDANIYSFGVLLFELLSGRFANDPIYIKENSNGIVPIACSRFNNETIRELVDPRLMEETHENILTLGPSIDSLHTFSKIAHQCVAKHPTWKVIVNKLEEALYFQENIKDHLKFSLKYIFLATQNFSNVIGKGGSSTVYKGKVKLTHADGYNTIAVKRMDRSHTQEDRVNSQVVEPLLLELQTLIEYKHENVINIVGYCIEKGENIIVYEYASRGSLDKYLKDNCLTWMKRLQICIDIAKALEFLHEGGVAQEVVIHGDMKPSKILLNDDWKAKISDFEISSEQKIGSHIFLTLSGDYIDPLYMETHVLTTESDIFSFGVVLVEILSGRFVYESIHGEHHSLIHLFKSCYEEGKLDEMVFEGMKEQVAPHSLTSFTTIAYQCLSLTKIERPTSSQLLLQLMQALAFQEDHDVWVPKLPIDYKQIIELSNSPEIYFTKMKKDLYDILSEGILLQDGKVLFSLDSNGEKNEMISARTFSYTRHRWSHKWRSVPESRFDKVAKMFDISNLKIQAKIKPQFLSPGVSYGVHLVFKFCEPRKSLAKLMYVNLKYKNGSETLHAYFATMREDGWMMIELCRFSNYKEDTEFEFLLESFSLCYCGSRAMYVEGIEFRAIKKCDDGEKLFSPNKVNEKKCYTLSAKEALYGSSNVKLFKSKTSADPRFQDAIQLPRQQIFRIKCKIESRQLSPDTKYVCYLVFKLSEKCDGLHCPVIVHDLTKRKKKETRILYFRSPSPCNVDDAHQVPEEREDGWMEVNVWQFNSKNQLRDDCVSVSLKLISYQGTMSGLVVSGLEFGPCKRYT